MLDQKRLPYQLKRNLLYLKQAQFSKASVYAVHCWQKHCIDDIFIVKFGQNSFLYRHQNNAPRCSCVIVLRRRFLIPQSKERSFILTRYLRHRQ